jgi:uncharacterized protein YacL
LARKAARLILALCGAGIGVVLVIAVNTIIISLGYLSMYQSMYTWGVALIYTAAGIITAIILYFISPRLIDGFLAAIGAIEAKLASMAIEDIFFSVIGLMTGLILAFLVSTLTSGISMSWLRFLVDVILYFSFGYLGWTAVSKRRGELAVPSWLTHTKEGKLHAGMARPKVLDTSVIIDGRIADICATGIIEGKLIVPKFVLTELQHIADSADSLKRNRGRRGLDILKMIQEGGHVPVVISEKDYDDVAEVDAKLIRLTHEMGGVVVTNDYNLNKVAGVQLVPVLNINELANAIKPLALPGEEMQALIVKEGKENGQGVAYLEDGTMIVVEGGKRHLNEVAAVVVTSVLQTAAGRMIFARIK